MTFNDLLLLLKGRGNREPDSCRDKRMNKRGLVNERMVIKSDD